MIGNYRKRMIGVAAAPGCANRARHRAA